MMGWARPRLTVRRMMVGIIAVALVMHLGITAYRVYWNRPLHAHAGIIAIEPRIIGGRQTPPYALWWVAKQPPFWRALGRAVLGLAWTDDQPCPRDGSVLLDTCVLGRPDVGIARAPDGSSGDVIGVNFSREQIELCDRLNRPDPAASSDRLPVGTTVSFSSWNDRATARQTAAVDWTTAMTYQKAPMKKVK